MCAPVQSVLSVAAQPLAAIGLAPSLAGQDAARKAKAAAQDAALAQARVEVQAAQSGNQRTALRRRALRANSLTTGGGEMASTGIAAVQRSTMGGA